MSESNVRIGVLLPEVLGTYGDTGNARILQERARRRGIGADIVTIDLETAIPEDLDVLTVGGGEDTAQVFAARKFRVDKAFRHLVDRGVPILAICASLQVLGHWYRDANDATVEGIGVLDVTTEPQGKRSIGEIVTQPLVEELTEPLAGFENHGGATALGPDARPLGRVLVGEGNGVSGSAGDSSSDDSATPDKVDGVVQGSIIATYLHGPVLARNPQLADLLLSRACHQELAPLDMPFVDALRHERLDAQGVC